MFFTGLYFTLMASAEQKWVTCGDLMALYDPHQKCARCREKGIATDPSVSGQNSELGHSLSPEQLSKLATTTCRSRKEKFLSEKGLVDPSTVTVLYSVEAEISNMSACLTRPAKAAGFSKPLHESPDVQTQMDNLQEEWATRFAPLQVLLTLDSRSVEKPVFSPVKVQVPCPPASVHF